MFETYSQNSGIMIRNLNNMVNIKSNRNISHTHTIKCMISRMRTTDATMRRNTHMSCNVTMRINITSTRSCDCVHNHCANNRIHNE